jgi:hypothetical protein
MLYTEGKLWRRFVASAARSHCGGLAEHRNQKAHEHSLFGDFGALDAADGKKSR